MTNNNNNNNNINNNNNNSNNKSTEGGFESAINETNPVTVLKEFLNGVYTIIDDILSIYVAIYNLLDKLTDNTFCIQTLPQILNSICLLENKIELIKTVFEELPNIIANSPELGIFASNINIIKTVVSGLFSILSPMKNRLIKDIGLDKDINVCADGQVLVDKLCVHLIKISENKVLNIIKKIGGVLVIFKRWFNAMEPIFKLERFSIGELISKGRGLHESIHSEIGEIGEDLDEETSNLKKVLQNPQPQSIIQVGGGVSKYNFIFHPYTREMYYLNSPKGIKTLHLYCSNLK